LGSIHVSETTCAIHLFEVARLDLKFLYFSIYFFVWFWVLSVFEIRLCLQKGFHLTLCMLLILFFFSTTKSIKLGLCDYHASNVCCLLNMCYYCMLFLSVIVWPHMSSVCALYWYAEFPYWPIFNFGLISNFSFVKFWFHSSAKFNWFFFLVLPYSESFPKIHIFMYLDLIT